MWLKNPAIIKDDFWSFFLTLWISQASVIIDFTRYFLPGKHAFAYYLCTGTDPTPDLDMPNKPTSFIEVATIIFNVVLIIRILIYNKKSLKTFQAPIILDLFAAAHKSIKRSHFRHHSNKYDVSLRLVYLELSHMNLY